jgi:threonyl-tRNA synthetase
VPDPGGAAFYGPKISVQAKDAIGRTWQMSTIQVDFNLPERFNLEFQAGDGSRQRPVMIHRALFGSIERFFGVLTEHYAGAFPAWLAPVRRPSSRWPTDTPPAAEVAATCAAGLRGGRRRRRHGGEDPAPPSPTASRGVRGGDPTSPRTVGAPRGEDRRRVPLAEAVATLAAVRSTLVSGRPRGLAQPVFLGGFQRPAVARSWASRARPPRRPRGEQCRLRIAGSNSRRGRHAHCRRN